MPNVFFEIVCPLLGALICNGMWLAPLPAVLQAQKKGDMGPLNPLPWVAAYLNCIAYTTYGILRKDFYMFFANFSGLCLSVYYALVALTVLGKSNDAKDIRLSNMVIGGLVFGLLFYSVLGMASGKGFEDTSDERAHAATAFGMTGMCFSIMYYAAPLSTAMRVIATKDASSFYAPMIILNFTNALLWLFYGMLAIGQAAVYVPNLVGCILAVFQLSLIFLYRNTSGRAEGHKALDDSGNGEVASPTPLVSGKTSATAGVPHNEASSPMWLNPMDNSGNGSHV